jgi:hypothetical protein
MDGMVAVFLTLFDIITRLKDNLALTPARRRDLISAVLRICKIVGVDPRITPASLQFMRPLINKVRPAKHNLRLKTWANLCSNFRAALVHALPRPPRQPDPAWERLRTALPNGRIRKGLSRFIGFCERERVSPERSATRWSRDFWSISKPTRSCPIRALASGARAGCGMRPLTPNLAGRQSALPCQVTAGHAGLCRRIATQWRCRKN